MGEKDCIFGGHLFSFSAVRTSYFVRAFGGRKIEAKIVRRSRMHVTKKLVNDGMKSFRRNL